MLHTIFALEIICFHIITHQSLHLVLQAKVLKDTPKPPAGGNGGEMTKADFLKLDTKAQMEFIKEHSDWQTILK